MCAGHTPYLHLAGLGPVPVTRADQLRPGDEVMWEHGNLTRVTGCRSESGRVVLTLAVAVGSPFRRTVAADAPVAGIRGGRWLGIESGYWLVCRVRMFGDRARWCAAEVDETGRCASGHYPAPDRLAVHRPPN